MKRKVTIEVETERTVVISGLKDVALWCPNCKQTVQVISLEDVSEFTSSDIGNLDLHFADTDDRPLLVCLNSLLKHLQKSKRK